MVESSKSLTILIATNGLAAVKFISSIKQWNRKFTITFICLTTSDEVNAGAEYLKYADQIHFLPCGENTNNFANIDEIEKASKLFEPDAIFVGWGHASENPDLSARLGEKMIGPSEKSMRASGDKLQSTIIAQSLGIPTTQWSFSHLKLKASSMDDVLDIDFENDPGRVISETSIGRPLMIKATNGGGGKGIRKVTAEMDLNKSIREVNLEVPGPHILMKCIENARHIEFQVLGDKHGNIVSLGSRDCTIQRRCQKVFEEAPATIVPPEVLKSMENDAIKFAEFLKYHCAGTVEFLFVPETNQYYFLELNPRLQVEHPCSEIICDVNIPAAKLLITIGFRLDDIDDVVNFVKNDRKIEGHVVAARITCEDPDKKFLPSTGVVNKLTPPSSRNTWSYFSVSSGSSVHQFSDSQFGHVFAKGQTRQEAIHNLTTALKLLQINATFPTQVNYLQDLLQSQCFMKNSHTTEFLDRRISANVKTKNRSVEKIVTVGAAAIGKLKIEAEQCKYDEQINKFWTNVELILDDVKYSTFVVSHEGIFVVFLNKQSTKVCLHKYGESSFLAQFNRTSIEYQIEETESKYQLHIDGMLHSFDKTAYDPLTLKSTFTGKFLHYLTTNCQFVRVGEPIAQIESMKMIVDVINDNLNGFVEHVLHNGDLIQPGTVIGKLQTINNVSEINVINNFDKTFENWSNTFRVDEMLSIIKLTGKCCWSVQYIIERFLKSDIDVFGELIEHFGRSKDDSIELTDLILNYIEQIGSPRNINYCLMITSKLYYPQKLVDYATKRVFDSTEKDFVCKYFTIVKGTRSSKLSSLTATIPTNYLFRRILCYTRYLMKDGVYVNNKFFLYSDYPKWRNSIDLLLHLDIRFIKLQRKNVIYTISENGYVTGREIKKRGFSIFGNSQQPTHEDFRRKVARENNTTYIHDFLYLFGKSAMNMKKTFKDVLYPHRRDWRSFIDFEELVFVNGKLRSIDDPGCYEESDEVSLSECSVVAWIVRLLIPCDTGKRREIEFVLIGNDVTFRAGSFAVPEHRLFEAASRFAREKKIPRVNISCNSGARIGLAMDVLQRIKIDENDGSIYVDECYEKELEGQIEYTKDDDGKLRISAVIGKEGEFIGVENLMGSGSIGGETSKAYREVPTYCYVTGRSVGIGAYTARLARRIVQHEKSSLILTGFSALNTLLGKKVYSSNARLGGVEVMENNGIAHQIVKSDQEGVDQIVKWLSYLPPVALKQFPFFDFDRIKDCEDVEVTEEIMKQDIRNLFISHELRQGLFDIDTFEEIRQNWAKSIVTGRARLCGQSVGVIGSQWCTTSECHLGDEAESNNVDRIVTKAGQVWYPNSAFKTSQAISDFNREKLPLVMVLSLRGFSGGRKDMSEMILTFGSHIIDELSQYCQPVVLYIPSGGELRGGAWAVVDSNVNPGFIHIVADKFSRGGILEPDAIVSIKLRDQQLSKILDRSGLEKTDKNMNVAKKAAVDFANKHDGWQRMSHIGAVEHVVEMKESRRLIAKVLRNESVKIEMARRVMASPIYPEISIHDAVKWINSKLAHLKTLGFDEEFDSLGLYFNEQFNKDLLEKIRESKNRFSEVTKRENLLNLYQDPDQGKPSYSSDNKRFGIQRKNRNM